MTNRKLIVGQLVQFQPGDNTTEHWLHTGPMMLSSLHYLIILFCSTVCSKHSFVGEGLKNIIR